MRQDEQTVCHKLNMHMVVCDSSCVASVDLAMKIPCHNGHTHVAFPQNAGADEIRAKKHDKNADHSPDRHTAYHSGELF